MIRKQRVVIEMSVKVIEYTAKEYRSRITGARVHAPFPPGYTNEVNYDGTVKALPSFSVMNAMSHMEE